MNNRTRWSIVAVLLGINVVANVALSGTWYQMAVSVVTGVGIIALVADYLFRGRRRES